MKTYRMYLSGRKALLVFVFVASVITLALVGAGYAEADLHEGSGGGATGGATGSDGINTNTSMGVGWYKFDINATSHPARTRSGDASWETIKRTCSDANFVIAYIIGNSKTGIKDSLIYNYPTYSGYENNGGVSGWISDSDAYNDYVSEGGTYWGFHGGNLGWFCYDTKKKSWSVNGQSYIQNGHVANKGAAVSGSVTATPGDRLNWYHDLRNNGPDAMDRTVYWNVDKTGFSNGWDSNKDPKGNTSGGAGTLFVYEYAQFPDEPWRGASPYTLYDVTQNDVGHTLCQRIAWQPGNWNDENWYASNYACASVPYNYSLVPTIGNITDGGTIEAGTPDLAVTGYVTNNGPTKSQTNIAWQLTEVKYAPGVVIDNKMGGSSHLSPCEYFNGGACRPLKNGNEAAGYDNHASVPYSSDTSIDDQPVGTRLCYALSVRPYNQNSSDWRHSQLYCLVVNKRPKVQVLGGDLIVGRGSATNPGRTSNVTTSVSRTHSNGYFGSWVEYGITTTGIVTGMASGSGFVGGSSTAGLCGRLSILTFSNVDSTGSCSEGKIGKYSMSSIAPSIAPRFGIDTSTPKLSGVADITSDGLSGVYTSITPILTVMSSGTIPAGRWVVVNAPNTTVTIASNFYYTDDDLYSTSQIPQVLIIAKNILITDDVKHIDAWLLAVGDGMDGRINTCAAGAVNESSPLTAKLCTEKLVVNGPTIANHLILRRTAGAGIGLATGDPAEVFNLRADAYLWALNHFKNTASLQTVTTKELPPRF